MKLAIVLCTIFAIQISYANCMKDYTGYKTYRVTFEKSQVEQLRSIVDEIQGTEFWLFSTAQGISDVFTAPDVEEKLLTTLKRNGFKVTLLNGNIQGLIDEESLNAE